jgi:hypothetical protein
MFTAVRKYVAVAPMPMGAFCGFRMGDEEPDWLIRGILPQC